MSNISKPDLSRCLRLLDDNFSLITVSANKVPNIAWKEYQTNAMKKDTFENFYNMPNSSGVGIVTGFENLEVIDIDLKVLSTPQEKEEFWNEYLSFLKDNIDDFETKFVIVKTRNSGFHILYKCEEILGNKKIATLKGQSQAIIESRGKGGYVWIYDQFTQGKSYAEIKQISVEDREILWSCSKIYNYVDDVEVISQPEFTPVENSITPWQDFNDKNSVWNLVSSEFTIVRKLSNKIVIKRQGATSPHSGYIFENSKCMYLFSTGTQYPNEKLLSPFSVYAIQKHHGNYSEAAKRIYADGYGSRIKKVIPEIPLEIIEEKEVLSIDSFPIDVFPESIQLYIMEIHRTLNASIDYLGCSMLWILSLCIGNSIKLEIKKGWIESGIVWIAIVGKAGIGKTHNIKSMIFPLKKINEREVLRYNENMKKYLKYEELSKKEKEFAEEIKEPVKTQFIVGDITIEAFFEYHEQNKNGIGIFRDELSGWIKDLNKYRPGSDLETYLSCWSNDSINLTRKTAKSSYVPNAFVPILGGVQPSILSLHYTPENKDNGFIDRILLCYPDLEVERYNEKEISNHLYEWYENYIISFFEEIKQNITTFDNSESIKSTLVHFDKEAKIEWIRIFNKITDLQNSNDENEYMKSILPKQKSYVARFSLLINTLFAFVNNCSGIEISKKSILGAEKLSDYFIKMAKKNKFDSIEHHEMMDIIKQSGKITAKDKFNVLYLANPQLNKSKTADELNVSRVTIDKWVKEKSVK